MKEKVKTGLLVALVVTSFIQTFLLASGQPEFDPISQDEYIEAEWVGPQETLPNLMVPSSMIVHMGQNQHTVFYPQFQFYDLIFSQLRDRTFGGFREVSYSLLNVPSMRELEQGIEIRFMEPVPVDVLKEMMSLRADAESLLHEVNRIWITVKEDSSEVKSYFFTKSAVYEATSSDLLVRDLEQFVRYGQQMPAYRPVRYGEYYVPLESLTAMRVELRYDTYTPEQLQMSLFADPGASRNLLEQNGVEIFTDGKRGLQVDHAELWMRFSDPSAPVDSRLTNRIDSLKKAMQFVNRHGGWNGSFVLDEVVMRPFASTETYLFRQLYAPLPNQTALPIIPSRDGQFGTIEVTVQQGMITNYERSILSAELEPMQISEVEMPGGDELLEMIENTHESSVIEDVFIGYYPVIEKDRLVLIPKWTAKMGTAEYHFLH